MEFFKSYLFQREIVFLQFVHLSRLIYCNFHFHLLFCFFSSSCYFFSLLFHSDESLNLCFATLYYLFFYWKIYLFFQIFTLFLINCTISSFPFSYLLNQHFKKNLPCFYFNLIVKFDFANFEDPKISNYKYNHYYFVFEFLLLRYLFAHYYDFQWK